jgi:hypothetical protein
MMLCSVCSELKEENRGCQATEEGLRFQAVCEKSRRLGSGTTARRQWFAVAGEKDQQ